MRLEPIRRPTLSRVDLLASPTCGASPPPSSYVLRVVSQQDVPATCRQVNGTTVRTHLPARVSYWQTPLEEPAPHHARPLSEGGHATKLTSFVTDNQWGLSFSTHARL